MTIRIKELNIKATLSGDLAAVSQEDEAKQMPTNSLLHMFYSNESSIQKQER